MKYKKLEKFLSKNPGYLKWGDERLATRLGIKEKLVNKAKSRIKSTLNFMKVDTRDYRVLIIGDTHIPYEKKGYLEFCKKQYDEYNCNEVVHIGDLIDSHATSMHPSIPDAYSAGDELKYTLKKLKKWYKAFPNMKVCIGNHDMRAYRIASKNKIASKWLKGFGEVLGTPNWIFEDSFDIDGTRYIHGTGTTGFTAAYRRALNNNSNVVMGHLHSESSIMFHKSPEKTIFGMVVGCGVDQDSYGMHYAKNFPKKSIISCGLVLDGQPILKIM